MADRDAIAAWYRREGWMEARVRGVLEVASGDVRVTFDADPGPGRACARSASPGGRISERTVRRAVQVRPGEVIRPQRARGDAGPPLGARHVLVGRRAHGSRPGTPGPARPRGELRPAPGRRARVRRALQRVGDPAPPRATCRPARARGSGRRRPPCASRAPSAAAGASAPTRSRRARGRTTGSGSSRRPSSGGA